MTKRELIDRIRRLNPTAPSDFLAGFAEEDLLAYLHQLHEIEHERERPAAIEPEMVEANA